MKERGMRSSEARKRMEAKPIRGMQTSEGRKANSITAVIVLEHGKVINLNEYRVQPMHDWSQRFNQ